MRTITFALAAAATALAVAGCGGSDNSKSTTKAPAAAAPAKTDTAKATGGAAAPASSSVKVDIKSFKFGPPDVSVKKGGKITWTNSDSADHTATADDKSFDTGTLHQGDAKTATFDKVGTYSYTCLFHPFMKGRVVVQ